MAKLTMTRTAADNVYLHKDFHGALSAGIEYLHQRYGEEAVRGYLRQFTVAFHAPLTQALKERGVVALEDHFERMYELEGGDVRLTCSEDELIVEVEACPAVTHMREHGYPVAQLFHETTGTVGEALCEGTPFAAELLEYDEQSGRSVQRFSRRER